MNPRPFWAPGLWVPLVLLAACDIPPPKQQLDARLKITRKHPHDEPGASLTETELCSCVRCEVASCCREYEQEQEQPAAACDSYDFEKCNAGMAVSSCEGRCYQHKWRADREAGCEASRPKVCCYADI